MSRWPTISLSERFWRQMKTRDQIIQAAEAAVRDALQRIPELARMGEAEYCDVACEAVDNVAFAFRMRQEELADDDEIVDQTIVDEFSGEAD